MSSKKILITARHFSEFSPEQMNFLVSNGYEVEENTTSGAYTYDLLIEKVKDVYAVFAGLERWDDSVFKAAQNLKLVCRAGVGYDNIDLESAKKHGVIVANTAGSNSQSVAEHALSLMLSLKRHLPRYDHRMKQGRWIREISTEISGQTVGLIGVGRIGTALSSMLKGFNVQLLGFDAYTDNNRLCALGIVPVSFEYLVRSSDIISLHVPETPETRHMINKETLAMMKKSVLLVNTARGGLVNEKDLYDALVQKTIAGAALDVFKIEPVQENNLFLSLENVIVTPHISAYTREAFINAAKDCISALQHIEAGLEPENRII